MKNQNEDNYLTLCAVGDVQPMRSEPERIFDLCSTALKSFDIRMCQLETNFVGDEPNLGEGNPHSDGDPRQIAALTAGGFDIATCAGNHALFGGTEALLSGIELMHKHDIKTVGVGKNIAEARSPVIFECKGMKLAFLDYNSILHEGEWATESRPGVAPLRVKTVYEMLEPSQPGTPARVLTYPDVEDLLAMLEDIKKAKTEADVLVLSMHWGIHNMPVKLANYQKPVAHAAIDAGADIIIGTHPHILKGIEVYKGKVIFYSIGNFAFDSARTKITGSLSPRMKEKHDAYNFIVDPEWARGYPYPADNRKTIVVKCTISNKKITRVSFLPAMIQIDARPRVVTSKDSDFTEVLKYMQEITQKAGLNASYQVKGDEVVVLPKL